MLVSASVCECVFVCEMHVCGRRWVIHHFVAVWSIKLRLHYCCSPKRERERERDCMWICLICWCDAGYIREQCENGYNDCEYVHVSV